MRRTENEAWAIFDTLCPVIIFTSFEPLFSRPKTHVPPGFNAEDPRLSGVPAKWGGWPQVPDHRPGMGFDRTAGYYWAMPFNNPVLGVSTSGVLRWAGWLGVGGEDTWCSHGSFRDGGGNEASSGVDDGMLQTVEDWFVPQPHPFFPIQQV